MVQTLETVPLTNGVHIPLLGMGTTHSGGYSHEAVVYGLKHCGYRMIDTAKRYGVETFLGEAVKDSGVDRENLFLISKLWPTDLGFQRARQTFTESCRRLGTDYLDCYMLHYPIVPPGFEDPDGNVLEETWHSIEMLLDEGRVRSIGVSNFEVDDMEKLLDFCSIKPHINQSEFHPFQNPLPLRRQCEEHGVLFMVRFDLCVRSIGVSNFEVDDMEKLLDYCSIKPHINQSEFHPFQNPLPLRRQCEEHGVLFMVRFDLCVRSIGVSNFEVDDMEKLLDYCSIKPHINQSEFHPFQNPLPLRRQCEEHGVLFMVRFDLCVRSIGVSNFGVDDMEKLLDFCSIKPHINQSEFHPFQNPLPLRRQCEEHGVLFMVRFDLCVRSIGVSNFGVDDMDKLLDFCSIKPHITQSEFHPFQNPLPLRRQCEEHGVLFMVRFDLCVRSIGVSNFEVDDMEKLLDFCSIKPHINQSEFHPFQNPLPLRRQCEEHGVLFMVRFDLCVRSIGVSNFEVDDMEKLLDYCSIKPHINQSEFHPFQNPLPLRRQCEEHGVLFMVRFDLCVRSIGVSNFEVDDMEKLLDYCSIKPHINQSEFHPFQNPLPLRRQCEEHGVLFMVRFDLCVRSIGVSNFGVDDMEKLLDFCSIKPHINQSEFHPFQNPLPLRRQCEEHGVLFMVRFDLCVRSIGVSNFGVDDMDKLLDFCSIKPHITQSEFHPFQNPLPLRRQCEEHGVLFMVRFDLCVRSIGVSNFEVDDMEKLLDFCSIKPHINQSEFHPFQNPLPLRRQCEEHGVLFMGYCPLAKGTILTERSVQDIASRNHCTPAQACIRWSIQQGIPAIPKSTKLDRVKENSQVFHFNLDVSDMSMLNSLNDGRRVVNTKTVLDRLHLDDGYKLNRKPSIVSPTVPPVVKSPTVAPVKSPSSLSPSHQLPNARVVKHAR